MNIAQQTKLYGNLTFEESKALVEAWYKRQAELGAILNAAPKAGNGGTLENAKTPIWRKAHAEYYAEREVSRWLIAYHTRTFKKQLAAERKAKIDALTRHIDPRIPEHPCLPVRYD
jgi:hypothetical protein